MALSLLVALDYGTLTFSRTAGIVAVTLVGVWFAKSYAYVVGGELAVGGRVRFSETIGVFKDTVWVLAPGIPILGMCTLAAAGIISLKTAISLSQWMIIAFLFATGFWLRRQVGGSLIKSVMDGLIDCSIGILIVALKFVVK
jgi:hypothetical protein